MKIIKHGQWKLRVTCRGCSSILECEVNDIACEQRQQPDESFAWSFYISCASCSQKIVLSKLPAKIKKEVVDRNN